MCGPCGGESGIVPTHLSFWGFDVSPRCDPGILLCQDSGCMEWERDLGPGYGAEDRANHRAQDAAAQSLGTGSENEAALHA
jgi:hypothetical protein